MKIQIRKIKRRKANIQVFKWQLKV